MGVLDVRVQAHSLNAQLSGALVANVYDVNARTYLLKLAVPPRFINAESTQNHGASDTKENEVQSKVVDDQSSWKKILLLIESGARVHTTNFNRDKSTIPSGFSIKLRKHIRTKRLESIKQVGSDRVLDLTFCSAGQPVAHLILEFYAAGNVILTDENYQILSLLRSYQTESANVAVKETYPIASARPTPTLTRDDILRVINTDKPNALAKKILSAEFQFGPQLVEHVLYSAGFSNKTMIKELQENSEQTSDLLVKALEPVEALLRGERVESLPMKGFIFYSDIASTIKLQGHDSEAETVSRIYEDFSPFLFAQYVQQARNCLEFESFDDSMDEFFSRLESQKEEQVRSKKESAVMKKVEKLKADLNQRVSEFQEQQTQNESKARLIEANVDDVEAVIYLMRQAIASGLHWNEIERTIKQLQKSGNATVQIIHSLALERNQITLMLNEPEGLSEDEDLETEPAKLHSDKPHREDEDDDEDAEDWRESGDSAKDEKPTVLVDISLDLSAYANATKYYGSRKLAESKEDKALKASEKALKVAEAKAREELFKVNASVGSVREIRKTYWFEKFYWFISSENFLVIAGRDAQQNELVVRRYLAADDVYVHADIHGASSVIVKNRKIGGKFSLIPPLTLSQAGTFAMCRSSAWTAKIVTSAWWVYAHQVSKSAPTGEYLTTGSFIIRGRKNYLPPMQLVMGFGLLFRIDPSCAVNHLNERPIRGSQTDEIVPNERTLKQASSSAEHNGRNAKKEKDEGDHESNTFETVLNTESVSQPEVILNSSSALDAYSASLSERLDDTGLPEDPKKMTHETKADEEDTIIAAPLGRKYLTAKQRREMKKGGAIFDEQDGIDENGKDKDGAEVPEEIGSPLVSAAATSTGPVSIPRGKKAKLKKMKKKYAEQDEIERELALKLLGAAKMKEEIVESEENNAQMSVDAENDEKESENEAKLKSEPRAPRRDQKREARAVQQLMKEEGIVELSDAEAEALSSLDLFTAVPISEDVIQFGIPVCAPYSALTNYRYKVKLLPGTLKRGKAWKQAQNVFQVSSDKGAAATSELEKEMIKSIRENDALLTIMGDVRVQAPGIQAAQQKSKSKAKQKAYLR